jgi:hypothetical protein
MEQVTLVVAVPAVRYAGVEVPGEVMQVSRKADGLADTLVVATKRNRNARSAAATAADAMSFDLSVMVDVRFRARLYGPREPHREPRRLRNNQLVG